MTALSSWRFDTDFDDKVCRIGCREEHRGNKNEYCGGEHLDNGGDRTDDKIPTRFYRFSPPDEPIVTYLFADRSWEKKARMKKEVFPKV